MLPHCSLRVLLLEWTARVPLFSVCVPRTVWPPCGCILHVLAVLPMLLVTHKRVIDILIDDTAESVSLTETQ
jgi:hypothetical protein